MQFQNPLKKKEINFYEDETSLVPVPPKQTTDRLNLKMEGSTWVSITNTCIHSFGAVVLFFSEKLKTWVTVKRIHLASDKTYCVVYDDIDGIERKEFTPRYYTAFKLFEGFGK